MEAKVRNDSSLKPDLQNKIEQFEEFNVSLQSFFYTDMFYQICKY